MLCELTQQNIRIKRVINSRIMNYPRRKCEKCTVFWKASIPFVSQTKSPPPPRFPCEPVIRKIISVCVPPAGIVSCLLPEWGGGGGECVLFSSLFAASGVGNWLGDTAILKRGGDFDF
jgi:hypothetical protein